LNPVDEPVLLHIAAASSYIVAASSRTAAGGRTGVVSHIQINRCLVAAS